MSFFKGSTLPGRILTVLFFVFLLGFAILNAADAITSVRDAYTDTRAPQSEETFQTAFQTAYNDGFALKGSFVGINGLGARITGQRMLNDTLLLKNDYLLINWLPDAPTPERYTDQIDAIADFSVALSKRGIPLMFIQPASKMGGDPQALLPAGMADYGSTLSDDTFRDLRDAGVDAISARDEAQKEGLDPIELFYRTDHHWTPESALWMTRKVLQHMNTAYGWSIDTSPLADESLKTTTYPAWFLGSAGRRVGPLFAGVDDFTLIAPAADTYMMLMVPARGYARIGPYENSVMDTAQYESKDYFNKNPYAAYIGDYAQVTILNQDAPNPEHILVIKDSYGLPVSAFLSLCFERVDMIDLRWYTDMTAAQYIENTSPDAVYIIYSARNLDTPSLHSYGTFTPERTANHLLSGAYPAADAPMRVLNLPDDAAQAVPMTFAVDVSSAGSIASAVDIALALAFQPGSGADTAPIALQADSPVSMQGWTTYSATLTPDQCRGLQSVSLQIGGDGDDIFLKNARLMPGASVPAWQPADEDDPLYGKNLLTSGQSGAVLLQAQSIFLPASDNPYAYEAIGGRLLPQREYTLDIGAIAALAGHAAAIHAALYDFAEGKTVAVETFTPDAGAQQWHFTVPADAQNASLLLYSGLRGEAAGNAVQFDDVQLTLAAADPSQPPPKTFDLTISADADAAYRLESIYDALRAGTTYELTIGAIDVPQGDTNGISVITYDRSTGNALQTHILGFYPDEPFTWRFTVPQDTHHASLMLYAGLRSQTNGNTVQFTDIALTIVD